MRASAVRLHRQAVNSALSPALSTLRLTPNGVARALSAASASGNDHKPSPRSIYTNPSRQPASSSSSLSSLPRIASSHPPASRRSYSDSVDESSLVQTSTLSNGLRVTTEGTPGHFAAAGVYIDAGSRFERPWVPGESGVSHLLDRMAFKSTSNRSSDDMTRIIEKLGGNVMCTSSRDILLYQSAMFHQDLPTVMSVLADTIQHPLLVQEELDAEIQTAYWEIQEIWKKPELINPELLHIIAYRENTLGNPLLAPETSLPHMKADNLRQFINTWYTPERMVVAGAGVPHELLVEVTEKLFGQQKPRQSVLGGNSTTPSKSSSTFPHSSLLGNNASSYVGASPQQPFSTTTKASATPQSALTPEQIATQKARYTGGETYIERSDLDFTHVCIAFEGVNIHDDDIYALTTLQVLLGGGSAFSAGGPGKGMYSRLYHLLTRWNEVDYCAASFHPYADSGLFAISASFESQINPFIGGMLAAEISACLNAGEKRVSKEWMPSYKVPLAVTEADLSRAKNQLKSSLMMALESRLVEVEDLARQILCNGKKTSVAEMCSKIDEVDMADIRRVSRRIFTPQGQNDQPLNHGLGSGQVTLVAQGQLNGLGDIRQQLYAEGIGAKPTLPDAAAA